MPFNGSGTYAAPPSPGGFNPAVSGQQGQPTDWNTLLADISSALSTMICRDGQSTVTGDIAMNGHKLTGLGDATGPTDALSGQSSWRIFDQQDIAAQTTVDFTGIPAEVNNLHCVFELRPSIAAIFGLRTYGADGVLDTAANDYFFLLNVAIGGSVNPVIDSAEAVGMNLTGTVDPGTYGLIGTIAAANIQAATRTKFNIQTGYLNSDVNPVSIVGTCDRQEAARITGIRIYSSAGTFTGKATLFVSI